MSWRLLARHRIRGSHVIPPVHRDGRWGRKVTGPGVVGKPPGVLGRHPHLRGSLIPWVGRFTPHLTDHFLNRIHHRLSPGVGLRRECRRGFQLRGRGEFNRGQTGALIRVGHSVLALFPLQDPEHHADLGPPLPPLPGVLQVGVSDALEQTVLALGAVLLGQDVREEVLHLGILRLLHAAGPLGDQVQDVQRQRSRLAVGSRGGAVGGRRTGKEGGQGPRELSLSALGFVLLVVSDQYAGEERAAVTRLGTDGGGGRNDDSRILRPDPQLWRLRTNTALAL